MMKRFSIRSQIISLYIVINKFSTVYDLKYDLKNAILNLSEDSMKTVIEAVKQKLGDTSFETQKSTSSGVTQFYSE